MAEEYLNFWDVFVNQVSGSEIIFLILSLVAIAYLAAKFRFPNQIILLISCVWLIMVSYFIPVLLPFVLVAIAIFFAIEVAKLIRDR